ncbi:MAG TPA: HAD family phosphatase [Vicinamibacterales bacterium]|nr:HAD family phosphatase [Vicinamibacterales bacterium]
MTSALQAIVFDFDGVIADSEPLHLKAYQQALAGEGLLLDREEYFARYLGYDDVGMLQALARDRRLAWTDRHITALVARKGVKLQAMLEGDQVLFPGAADFVRAAAAAVPIAIASGALRHEIVQIVDAAGLGGLFTAVVASGDTPESKPSPAPYLLAFERLQDAAGKPLDRQRCVAIEDSVWGLESARGAGLRCVGVTTSYPAAELTAAELVVGGLDALSLPMLEDLVK